MILNIDTTQNHSVKLSLMKDDCIVIESSIEAQYKQAEKLLPEIDKSLKKKKLKLVDISEIRVENSGGTFTSLRIGIVSANALAYALDIPIKGSNGKTINKEGINLIKPEYNAEPSVS